MTTQKSYEPIKLETAIKYSISKKLGLDVFNVIYYSGMSKYTNSPESVLSIVFYNNGDLTKFLKKMSMSSLCDCSNIRINSESVIYYNQEMISVVLRSLDKM